MHERRHGTHAPAVCRASERFCEAGSRQSGDALRQRAHKYLGGRPQTPTPRTARQQPFNSVAGIPVTMAIAPRLSVSVFKEQARALLQRRKVAFPNTGGTPSLLTLSLSPSPLPFWAPRLGCTSKVTPIPQSVPSPWAPKAQVVRSGIPGPRAGGRDGTRCSVVLSSANIALVPASGPLGPPGAPSPKRGSPGPGLSIPAELRLKCRCCHGE